MFDAPKSWTWGNGQPYARSFDPDGWIKRYPLDAAQRELEIDPAGRITGFTPERRMT